MKKLIFCVSILTVLLLSISYSIKPLVLSFAKVKIKDTFSASAVSIRDCEVNPLRGVVFSNIEIRRGSLYDFKLQKLKIAYALPHIIKGAISKVSLEGASIKVNMGNKDIHEFLTYCNFSSKGTAFFVEALELSELTLDIKSANVNIGAHVSLDFSLAKRTLDFIDLEISQFNNNNINVQDLSLNIGRNKALQGLYIREIGYDKIKVKEVKSRVNYNAEAIAFDPLSAEVLKGKINAVVNVTLGKTIAYTLDLKACNLDLENLAEDLRLVEKFQMSGKVGGSLKAKGQGLAISIIEGAFSITEPGGVLSIKDKKVIENIARSSKMPYEILVEGFKNYRYNNGKVALALQGSDVVLSAAFEGDAGNRGFDIRWHNPGFFNIGKE